MSADVQEVVDREIQGPFLMEGSDFPGCSNWSGSADYCTCATWESIVCGTCGRDVRDGQWVINELVWLDTDIPGELEPAGRTHHIDCWNERGA